MRIPIKYLILTPFFSVLTIIGAFIKIPFPLAPLTLQILFVLMSGFILGPKYGALSQILYIVIGLTGIPVFAYGGGLGYIFNPTFGFLLGFVLTAYIAGSIYEKNRTFKGSLIGGIFGLFACYIIGLPYLFIIFNYYLAVEKTILEVIKGAMLIFLPGDALKIIFSSYLSKEVLRRIPGM